MATAVAGRPPLLEWGVATHTLPGQVECGDLHVIQPFAGGVMVGVVDGLGHGEEAAAAAKLAVATLSKRPEESVLSLVRHCHRALRGTRGVVMSIASLSGADDAMTWLGIGNVEGVLYRADAQGAPDRESILLRGGVVGYELPPLRAVMVPISRGDTLLLATDGIRAGFADDPALAESPQRLADHILAKYARETDDALVLAVRYLGTT
ncbi:MAG: SpoIIE family protein phosphatase [Anaerolineales bacterium]